MADVIDALPGAYFTLRVYKKLSTNQDLVWANAYEFVNLVETSNASIQALITAVVGFEQMIHGEEVLFDRAVFSSWVPDGDPYDPDSFLTEPLVGNGNVLLLTPLSLNYCLFVRRKTLTGQNGKLFYRRCLAENQVDSPAGHPNLTNPAALQVAINDAVVGSGLTEYMDGSAAFQMVMKSALLIQRDITAFVVGGVRVIQYNNRYFDVP